MEDIHFGEERIERLVRVYNNERETVGRIKKQDGKPKWIWLPCHPFREKFPHTILDSDLARSKQIVHKIISGW